MDVGVGGAMSASNAGGTLEILIVTDTQIQRTSDSGGSFLPLATAG